MALVGDLPARALLALRRSEQLEGKARRDEVERVPELRVGRDDVARRVARGLARQHFVGGQPEQEEVVGAHGLALEDAQHHTPVLETTGLVDATVVAFAVCGVARTLVCSRYLRKPSDATIIRSSPPHSFVNRT